MNRWSWLVVMLGLGGCAGTRADSQPWVRTLTLEGVDHVQARPLKSGLALKPTSFWQVRSKRRFDELLLDGDRQRVLRYYQAQGYFNAEIAYTKVEPRRGHSVEVIIGVEEGLPTLIDEMTIAGREKLDPKALAAVEKTELALRRGQRFVHEEYLHLKDAILSAVKERGYAFAALDGDVTVDRSRNVALVALALEPGPRATFGTLEVVSVGVSRIPAYLVREVFGVVLGQPFKLSELEDGRARLLQLGVFANVEMHYAARANDPQIVDLVVKVRDASMHELRIGGGIGIEPLRNELRLQLIYTKRNFLGGLRTLELRARPAYVFVPAVWQKIVRHGPALTTDAIFTQPRLGWITKLQWTVGYDVGVEYAYQYHGPRTQLALLKLLWKERISIGVSYNFQLLDFFATSPEILVDPSQAGAKFGYTDPYRLGWLQQDLRFDWRDSRLDTKRGVLAELSFEEGGAFAAGAFSYQKIRTGLRGYAPLGSRVVLAARIEFTQLFAQGEQGTPITRRTTLGGANSHRGFTEARLSPQLLVKDGPALPIGGDQSLLLTAEVRVGFARLGGSMLSGAAFVDAGDVAAAKGDTTSGWPHQIIPRILHVAVGTGLRYATPIGVLRADIGVRVNRTGATTEGFPNPDPGQRVAYHISLSEAF